MKHLFFLLLFLIPITLVYADTYDDVDLVMDDSTVEINSPLTAYELTVEDDGFSTRKLVGDDLRKYTFDRTFFPNSYNIDWLDLKSENITFNVITPVTDSRLVVTGTELNEVILDGSCAVFTFGAGENTISVLTHDLGELLFSGGIPCALGGSGGSGNATLPIQVASSGPCFLNLTAGHDLWENCGFGEDYLLAILLPWEWITGGYFSLVFVSLLVTITYIKYHKVIYPLIVGLVLMPVSYYLFPSQFTNIAFIIVGLIIGIFIYSILLHRTKDY